VTRENADKDTGDKGEGNAGNSNLQKLIHRLTNKGAAEGIDRSADEVSGGFEALSPERENSVLKALSELSAPSPGQPGGYKPEDVAANHMLQAVEALAERREWLKAEKLLKFIITEFRGTSEATLAQLVIKQFNIYIGRD
jgi:hypothetical protein